MRRRIIIHNHLPSTKDADDLQRYAGDVIWTDVSEREFDRLSPGDTIPVDGIAAEVLYKEAIPKKFGPLKTAFRVKVRFKARGGDSYFKKHPMDVGRDAEERYRDAAYKKTGITRMARDAKLIQYNSGRWGFELSNGKVVGPYPSKAAAEEAMKHAPKDSKSESDPDYEKWRQQQSEEQNKRGGGFHDRRARDTKFRISTESGDTYTIEAKTLQEAQRYAREQHEGERFTVYEDRPIGRSRR